MSRIRVMMAVLLTIVLTLGGVASAAKTKITFMPLGQAANMRDNDFEGAVARFNAMHPTIEVELLVGAPDFRNYVEQVQIQVATGAVIDILAIQPHVGLPFAFDNITRDLMPFIERDPDVSIDMFLPGSVDGLMLGSKVWGLPTGYILRGNAINLRLLGEAGFATDNASEWTWDDVREVGRKLTIDRDGDGQPDIYGVDAGNRPRTLILHPLAAQAGGTFYDAYVDPKLSLFDTEAARVAIEYYMSFFLNNQTALRDPSRGFSRGAAAYTMDAFTWSWNTIDAIGHREIEFIPGARGPVRGGFEQTAYGVHMGATSENPEAAWEFIKYLTSNMNEIEARFAADRPNPYMAAWIPSVPLYLQLGDDVVPHMDRWIEIAGDPDNRPRYATRESVQVTNVIENTLESVARNERPLNSAIEEIHRQVQLVLNDAHSR